MIIIDKTDACFAPVHLPYRYKDGGKINAIVKRQYTIQADGTLKAYPKDQQPRPDADVPYQDDLGRSIRHPSDVVEYKPLIDLIVNGHACAPRGTATTRMNVAVALAGWRKELTVFGDRYWLVARDGTWYMTDPAPFEQMPLRWEKSFGSMSDFRNLMGKGGDVDPQSDPEDPVYPLPNIENPNALIAEPWDSPDPVNFGAIPQHWQSREQKAGTRDMFWATFRAPDPPRDQDSRYYNAAPDDQQFDSLIGNETIYFENMDPDDPFKKIILPGMRPRLFYTTREDAARELREIPLGFDTIVVDLDVQAVTLLWRGSLEHPYEWINESLSYMYLNEEPVDEAPTSRDRYQKLFEEEIPQYEKIYEILDISGEKMQNQIYGPVVDQIVKALKEVEADEKTIADFQQGQSMDDMLQMAKTKSEDLAANIRKMLDDLGGAA